MFKRSPGWRLAAVVTGYAALWVLAPRATFLPHLASLIGKHIPVAALALIAAPTVVFMAVQVGIVYCFARMKMDWPRAALALLGSLAWTVGMVALMVWQSGVAAKMRHWPSLRETMFIMGVYPSLLRLPMFLGIIFAASSIGYLVAMRVRDKNLLLPVVMFAAWVDFWTVTQGPVSAVLKRAPEVANAIAAPIPAAGTGAFVPRTLVGPGDFLFMALVFAAVHRLRMNGPRNYWFVFIGMTAGMLAVLFGLIGYLPALIVLAVSVVAANWREFKLTRQEAISTAIVGVLLVASMPLVWSLLGSGRERPKHKKPAIHRKAPQRTSSRCMRLGMSMGGGEDEGRERL